jgi:tetratricopeptide (TPR) repeat protein/predicted Ser/Thr protein kinase
MNSSSRERRQRIESIFQEALDAAPDAREALLDARCGHDAALRCEVETLIAHYESAQESFPFEALTAPSDRRRLVESSIIAPTEPETVAGRRIGPYRLIREIGIGGMARVYLAEREDLPRRVAIKLAREPLASPERAQRFRFEQWILAGLEHPAIAQLYDAGVTEDGTPYFAMEYVEGEPLDSYCDRRHLDIEKRIELMLQVLEPVQHFHEHLVIHRDLKPSNILVTKEGQPKLLDFGIAKLLSADRDSELTRMGLQAFSPAYAAPEQLRSQPVTTATDVYQLGIILYKLMSGALPYDLQGRNLAEISRIVLEREPQPASARVSAAAAAERGTTPDRLRRRLRGDLDHIMAMALEKNPTRRYPSAHALATDLRNFLDHLPLVARPATAPARARKFVMRHKLGVGVAAALFLYAATATLGLVRIGAERDRARREADTATRVSDFLVEVFAAADPGDTTTATPLQLVDRGAARAEEDLVGEPVILASMQEVLGRVYHNLGRDERAEDLLRKSLAARGRLLASDAVEMGDTKHYLAQVMWSTGDLAAADTLVQQALEIRRRAYGEKSDQYWEGLSDLATIRQATGDLDEAERILRELIADARRTHPEGYPWLGPWLNNLANVYMDQGRRDEAEAMMRQALESDRQVLPEPHPDIALRLSNLSTMAAHAGRYEESLKLAEEALAEYQAIYDGPHPDIPYALTNLGNAALELGNIARADSAQQAALAMREELFPPDHIGLMNGCRAYGEYLVKSGRYREALPYLERWRDLALKILGEEHYSFGLALWTLGVAFENLGQEDQAESHLRRGLAIHRRVLAESHPRVTKERYHLVEFLRSHGKPLDAVASEAVSPEK